MHVGHEENVKKAKEEFGSVFECDDEGEMKEFVGGKIDIDRKEQSMKITQPVLLRSFKDEFELPKRKTPTPLPEGKVFRKATAEEMIGKRQQKMFRSAVGKLLHSRWSRPMELKQALSRSKSRSV